MSAAPTPAQLKQPKFLIGLNGERRAWQFLKNQNYSLIAHHIRWKQLEIDLIVQDPETKDVCFVEVKTRTSNFLPATSSISTSKQRALMTAARIFQASSNYSQPVRIDVITVQQDAIEHYQDIGWWR